MDRAPQRHHRASRGKRPYGPAGRWQGLPGSSGDRERWEETGWEVRRWGGARGERRREGLAGEGGTVRQDRSP